MPVRSYFGSDYLKVRPDLRQITDPFTGQRVILTPPIIPDFCLIHAFYADEEGNVLMDRASDAGLAAKAAKTTFVTVEAIVDDLAAVRTPDMKRLPWVYVSQIILAPRGGAPTVCPGFYEADHDYLQGYLAAVKAGQTDDWLVDNVMTGGES